MDPALQYVTKNEFDLRMKHHEEKNDMQISEIKEMFKIYMENLKAVSDKNLAELKAANAEMREDFANFRSEVREDINEIRGDIKALNAKVDAMGIKFGWALGLLSLAVTVAIFWVSKM